MTPHPYAKQFRQALAGFTPPRSIRWWAKKQKTTHSTVSRVLSGETENPRIYGAITVYAAKWGPK